MKRRGGNKGARERETKRKREEKEWKRGKIREKVEWRQNKEWCWRGGKREGEEGEGRERMEAREERCTRGNNSVCYRLSHTGSVCENKIVLKVYKHCEHTLATFSLVRLPASAL